MKSDALVLLIVLAFSVFLVLPSSQDFLSHAQQGTVTLTVGSKPGGSVIVQSTAIDQGEPYTVAEGQEQTFTVTSGTSVTLKAVPIDSQLLFKGWDGPLNGKPYNPSTITLTSDTQINGYFESPDAPNVIYVTAQSPQNVTYLQQNVSVAFTLSSPFSPGFGLGNVFLVRIYLDGAPLFNDIYAGHILSYNTTLTITNGTHSLFILACADFEETATPPPYVPSAPSPGSGFSDIIYFTVGAPLPSPTPTLALIQTPTPTPSLTTAPSASVPEFAPWITLAIIVTASLLTASLIRKRSQQTRAKLIRSQTK